MTAVFAYVKHDAEAQAGRQCAAHPRSQTLFRRHRLPQDQLKSHLQEAAEHGANNRDFHSLRPWASRWSKLIQIVSKQPPGHRRLQPAHSDQAYKQIASTLRSHDVASEGAEIPEAVRAVFFASLLRSNRQAATPSTCNSTTLRADGRGGIQTSSAGGFLHATTGYAGSSLILRMISLRQPAKLASFTQRPTRSSRPLICTPTRNISILRS